MSFKIARASSLSVIACPPSIRPSIGSLPMRARYSGIWALKKCRKVLVTTWAHAPHRQGAQSRSDTGGCPAIPTRTRTRAPFTLTVPFRLRTALPGCKALARAICEEFAISTRPGTTKSLILLPLPTGFEPVFQP